MRVVEWFSGIGGCRAALPQRAEVVLAIDQDEAAQAVYAAWWGDRPVRWNVAGVRPGQLPDADLWWASPPCQPYGIRGRQRDLDDPRSRAFLRWVALLRARRPPRIGLENVPWFQGSEGHRLLRETLDALGYHVDEAILCPTALGVPMVRRRYFLAASRIAPVRIGLPPPVRRPLSAYLGPTGDTAIPPAVLDRFRHALHVVDAADPDATTACFTGAYGHSPVHAGSYLRDGDVLRRFSPVEIARLMGFPRTCRLPDGLRLRKAYKLVGNSVSVDCVRPVLAALGLGG